MSKMNRLYNCNCPICGQKLNNSHIMFCKDCLINNLHIKTNISNNAIDKQLAAYEMLIKEQTK